MASRSPVAVKTRQAMQDQMRESKAHCVDASIIDLMTGETHRPSDSGIAWIQDYGKGMRNRTVEHMTSADMLERELSKFPRSRVVFSRDKWEFKLKLSTVDKVVVVKCGLHDYKLTCGWYNQTMNTAIEVRTVVEDLIKFGYLII